MISKVQYPVVKVSSELEDHNVYKTDRKNKSRHKENPPEPAHDRPTDVVWAPSAQLSEAVKTQPSSQERPSKATSFTPRRSLEQFFQFAGWFRVHLLDLSIPGCSQRAFIP